MDWTKITYSEACSIYDYHERTGLLPKGMEAEQFDAMNKRYGLRKFEDSDIDPAGGYGLESHV